MTDFDAASPDRLGRVPSLRVPILEIGGSHVTVALAGYDDELGWRIERDRRWPLPVGADAETIISVITTAGTWLDLTGRQAWGIAVPGPFDYATGIARYRDVGKFDCLNGVNLASAIRAGMSPTPGPLHFLNDADAYGLGEGAAGAALGHDRFICLTLGTGVGSAFIAGGQAMNAGPGVPPDGEAHLITVAGRPLEETVSTRAIRLAYCQATGEDPDVREIAARARAGEAAAQYVIYRAMGALGEAMSGYAQEFGASLMVLGGSISNSFDLLEEPLRRGLDFDLVLRPAQHVEHAPLLGAAAHVRATTAVQI